MIDRQPRPGQYVARETVEQRDARREVIRKRAAIVRARRRAARQGGAR